MLSLIALICVVLSLFLLQYFPANPLQLFRGLQACGLILLGIAMKDVTIPDLPSRSWMVLLYLFFFISVAFLHFYAKNVILVVLSLVACNISGSICASLISKLITRCGPLEYIGKNSLVFYAVNQLVLAPVLKVIQHFGISNHSVWVQWEFTIAALALSLLVMTFLNILIQKHLYWTIGRKRPGSSWHPTAEKETSDN
jgi:peptidoglycan/LPS O-acetylase OafA/YrhL